MGSGGKDAVRSAQASAQRQLGDYQAQQAKQAKVLEKQKQAYMDIDFTNP